MLNSGKLLARNIIVFLLLLETATLAVAPHARERRTLNRESDPVILTGERLKAFAEHNADSLRLYAVRAGKLQPIPYQIDRRDGDGAYLFSKNGEEHAPMGLSDELVFMARDAGDRMGSVAWPAGASDALELAVKDPRDGGAAWVYLFHFPGAPPARSATRYAHYDAARHLIDTRNYSLTFCREAPIVFDSLTIKKSGAGSGANVLDRLKVRFHADTRLGVKIDRSENQFTSEVVGVINGPVRVVRATQNRMILYAKIPTPAALSNSIYYFDSFEFPVDIMIPVNLDVFLTNTYIRITSESARPWGAKFYNSRNPAGVLLNGKMTSAEKTLDRGNYRWQVVAGSWPGQTGGWLNRLVFDEKHTPAVPDLYYVDDNNAPDPPDRVAGQMGNVGYILRDVEKFGRGVHKLRTYMYNVRNYRAGAENKYLDILDRPLRVTVSRRAR